jgi:hypothetical protein
MEDKDRISEIMRYKGMLAKNFCEFTNISPASLSHILNGKTKASLPILKSIVDAFPEFNPLWILLGEGQMMASDNITDEDDEVADVQDIDNSSNNLSVADTSVFGPTHVNAANGVTHQGELMFDFSEQQNPKPSPSRTQQTKKTEPAVQPVKEVVKIIEKKPRKIVEIRIFYDDGTYETFS